MAGKSQFKYIENFKKNYAEDIKFLIGRELNTEDFEQYRKDIDEIIDKIQNNKDDKSPIEEYNPGGEVLSKIKKLNDVVSGKMNKKISAIKDKGNKFTSASIGTVTSPKNNNGFYDELMSDQLVKRQIESLGEKSEFIKELAKNKVEIGRIYSAVNFYKAKAEAEGRVISQEEEKAMLENTFEIMVEEPQQTKINAALQSLIDEYKENSVISGETAEEIAEETAEKIAEETAEEITKETAEKIVEETAEEISPEVIEPSGSKVLTEEEKAAAVDAIFEENTAETKTTEDSSHNNEEKEEPIGAPDTKPVEDLNKNTESAISDNEYENSYKVLDDEINAAIKNVEDIIDRYIQENNLTVSFKEGTNIQVKVSSVLASLNVDKKSEFVEEINQALRDTEVKKQKIANEYIKITEEGIEKVRQIRKKLEDANKTLEDLNLLMELKEEKENRKTEIESSLAKLEKDLEAAESETPRNQEKIDGILDEINSLKTEKADIDKWLNENKIDAKQIQEAQEEVKKISDEFESAEKNFIEAAEKNRKKLEIKGINVDIKVPEKTVEEDNQPVTENSKQPVVENPAPQTQSDAQTVEKNVTQQVENSTQQTNTQGVTYAAPTAQATEQTAEVKDEELPSTNLEPRQKFKNDFKNVIANSQDLDTLLKDGKYEEVVNYLDAINEAPFNLNVFQRSKLRKLFENNKDKILHEMADTYDINQNADKLKMLKEIAGGWENVKENSEVTTELSGQGDLFTYDEVNPDAQNYINKLMNTYYEKLKNNELTDEEIKVFNDCVMRPMRAAYLQQCAEVAGKFGGKKIFGRIPTGRKEVDGFLLGINEKIKDIDKEIKLFDKRRKELSERQPENIEQEVKIDDPLKNEPKQENEQPLKTERKQEMEQPKDFRSMLGNLIKSDDEINLQSRVEVTHYKAKENEKTR